MACEICRTGGGKIREALHKLGWTLVDAMRERRTKRSASAICLDSSRHIIPELPQETMYFRLNPVG